MSGMLINEISKSPKMMRMIGLLSVLLFGFLGVFSWKELQSFPSAPQHMSLGEASALVTEQRIWVVIDDIKWDCSHIYYKQINRSTDTNIVFTNQTSDLWGVALFDEEITCDDVMRKDGLGVLGIAIEKKRNQLASEGFDVSKYEANGKFLSLCAYCGRDNSKLGVILSTIMVIIGLLLIGRAPRRQEKIGPWDS